MPRQLFDPAPKKPYTPLQFETDERPCSATPPSPPPPSLRFKFVSIDSSGSAVVTPMSAAEAPSPPPRSPPRSPGKSPLPVIQVQLAPLELVSFGYDRGNAPSGCARTINCGHLAKACATCAASASSSGGASSSSLAAAAASWTSTPYIEELCSFLVCELQALVVSRSPSSAMSDRCFSPPLSPRLVASSPSSPGSPSTPSPNSGPAAPASLPPLPPPLLPAPPPRAADRGSLLVPVGAPVLDLTAFAAAAARAPSPPPPTLLHLSTSPLRLPADARASALVRRAPSPPVEWALDAAPAPGRGEAAPARVTLSCDGRRVRASVQAVAPPPAASSAAAAPACAAVRTPPRVGRSGGRGRVRVGIGCKDGESLSVMVVDHLAKQLERRGIAVTVKHRELQRARRRAEASF